MFLMPKKGQFLFLWRYVELWKLQNSYFGKNNSIFKERFFQFLFQIPQNPTNTSVLKFHFLK